MTSSKSPATNPKISPDPKHTGSVIRKAFFAEAMANLFTIPLITNTQATLSILLNHPATQITPATILFARLFGSIIVAGLTSALLFGTTNTRNGTESRRPTYLLLGLGEAALIPILAIEVAKGGRKDAAISVKVALASIGCLLPPLIWRIYVLGVKPELLGRYRESGGGTDARHGESSTQYGSIQNERRD